MNDMLFPSPSDVTAHKSAKTRRKKNEAAALRAASEIQTPDDLCDFILDIAKAHYRRGDRAAKFTVEVPSKNFVEWAQKAKVGTAGMDQMDKIIIRRSLVNRVKEMIKGRIRSNVLFMVEGTNSHKQCICFTVQINVLGPR